MASKAKIRGGAGRTSGRESRAITPESRAESLGFRLSGKKEIPIPDGVFRSMWGRRDMSKEDIQDNGDSKRLFHKMRQEAKATGGEIPWKQETVSVSSLHAGQSTYFPFRLKLNDTYDPIAPGSPRASKATGNSKGWEGRSVWVVRHNGKLFVNDGHHRAISEYLKGNKRIKVLVVDV